MHANSMCISCILSKQEKLIRPFEDEDKKSWYLHQVLDILYRYGQSQPAPWLGAKIDRLYNDFWGNAEDYTLQKKKYNQLLLNLEKEIEQKIYSADDAIKECIKYVCAANYIDFSAVENVNEDTLKKLLSKAAYETVSSDEYAAFQTDLKKSNTLAYLTDNCGEIVLDKLFIKCLKESFPDLQITVILRGEDVINDATIADAEEVGLTELVPCIGNGNGAPGTVLKELSSEAKQILLNADLVISKGQGNFESLYGEGLNPYYLFLCKCELFVRRFGLKQFEAVFKKEERIYVANLTVCRGDKNAAHYDY